MTHSSEVLLTDWEIFVGEILVHHLLPTHLTFHALGVNTGITKCDMALGDDLAADCTSRGVVTISTTCTVLLHIELLPQPLLTEFAPET